MIPHHIFLKISTLSLLTFKSVIVCNKSILVIFSLLLGIYNFLQLSSIRITNFAFIIIIIIMRHFERESLQMRVTCVK